MFDGSDFPKQGRKSAGGPAVLRQAGQGGQLPGWDVPGLSARWAGRWWTSGCICPRVGPPTRTGVLPGVRNYRSKTELALEPGPGVGLPQGRVGCRRRRLRDVADLPGGTGGPILRAGRSGRHYGLALGPGLPVRNIRGSAAPANPCGLGSGGPQQPVELPDEAWREITVAQGTGAALYRFSCGPQEAQARRGTVWRRNLDQRVYYLSNAPEGTTLETLAYVGGSRWRIETEFETEKGDVGLDEYETRSWAGWHHHIAMCLLGGAFLLSLQQALPRITRPQVTGWCGRCAPGAVRARSILLWLEDTQHATNGLAVPTKIHPPRKQEAATLNPSL